MPSETTDIPRSAKLFQVFWPVLAFCLIGGSYAVAAMAQASQVERRVVELEQHGPAVIRERLARIETQLSENSKQLDRIEEAVTDGSR